MNDTENRQRSPYDVLGVDPKASEDDLRKAYRKRAKALHPDLNPGDPTAEAKFQELAAAWDILGNADRRARFDRGEIDASGRDMPPRDFYRQHAGDARYRSDAGFGDFADASDLFSELFGRRAHAAGGKGAGFAFRGADIHFLLPVDFETAALGGSRRVTLPGHGHLDVTVPPGIETGQMLRLAGKGEPGHDGATAGDAIIEVTVRPHPVFSRRGDDVLMDLPISIAEAATGAKIDVPTLDGRVRVTIGRGGGNRAHRLRGKGVRRPDGSRGDQIIHPVIVAPHKVDDDLAACLEAWQARTGEDPRAGWKGRA